MKNLLLASLDIERHSFAIYLTISVTFAFGFTLIIYALLSLPKIMYADELLLGGILSIFCSFNFCNSL